MYVCIPCMTLATRINEEEKDKEEEVVETINSDTEGTIGKFK